MGADSSEIGDENLQKLKNETDIKESDIKKCHQKFNALDKEKKGFVSITDFVNIPELSKNPLRYYIAQNMSNNNNSDAVNFDSFIKVIDIFKNNKTEKQYKFMYELFDVDKDGKISSEDMLVTFKLLLGNSINEEQIMEIVDKTISECSSDQKYIYYKDFVKIMNDA